MHLQWSLYHFRALFYTANIQYIYFNNPCICFPIGTSPRYHWAYEVATETKIYMPDTCLECRSCNMRNISFALHKLEGHIKKWMHLNTSEIKRTSLQGILSSFGHTTTAKGNLFVVYLQPSRFHSLQLFVIKPVFKTGCHVKVNGILPSC